MSGLVLTWDQREPPLPPVAVLGTGAVAHRLAMAVTEEAAARLRIAAAPTTMLVLGEADDLPWADGARYLGREDGLLVPTTRKPSLPADLLRAALSETMPGQEFAVLDDRVLAFAAPTPGADLQWLREHVDSEVA